MWWHWEREEKNILAFNVTVLSSAHIHSTWKNFISSSTCALDENIVK
jgi:hypothetical protein